MSNSPYKRYNTYITFSSASQFKQDEIGFDVICSEQSYKIIQKETNLKAQSETAPNLVNGGIYDV